MSRHTWQCLSVKEFFNLCHWQGQPLRTRQEQQPLNLTLEVITEAPNSWQLLSVREFFSLCHWQGQPLNPTSQQLDPSSHLKEQVREFFQFIPWEGNPEIGSIPKISSLPQPSFPVKNTLTNLSDLF